MVARRPLVNISGLTTELPPGDSVVGGSVGTLTAGSGLNGGGDLSSAVTVNVSLAPNPSGLLFADGKLGVDGVAGITGAAALASGNFSLSTGTDALASGIAGSSLAATALASGNAALADINAIPGGTIETYTAASAVASGYAVGLDDGGSVQSVREIVDADSRSFGSAVVFESAISTYNSATYDPTNNKIVIAYQDGGNSNYGTAIVSSPGSSISPTISSQNNFIGIAQATVASGTDVSILLPRAVDFNQTGLNPGYFYYVDPTTSGFTAASGQPAAWSGAYNWGPVAKAVSSSGLLLLNPM